MFKSADYWIVSIIMVVFFGGLAYLAIRSKIEEKKENQNKNKQKDIKG